MEAGRILAAWVWVACLGLTQSATDDRGYFWQLNDLHYDPTYLTLQASCNEPVSAPGKYGDYRCDAPWHLVESAVDALRQYGSQPDFICWSGDLPAHYKKELGNVTRDLVLNITRDVTELLMTAFPDIPILPVLGNHDYWPKNDLPGEQTPFYEALAEVWAPMFNDEAVTDKFKAGGFYSKMISTDPPVRAVVPNTNLYNKDNSLPAITDPGQQLQWLEQELQEAENNGEKVFLLIHIPPGMVELFRGDHFYAPDYNTGFHEILQNYAHILQGVFAGHSHMDSFKMLYNNDGEPGTTVFVAPSVTPWQARLPDNKVGSKHNPGVRKVWFFKANYSLDDIEQFYLDLPRANQGQDQWMRLYTFKDMYKVPDVTATSMQVVLNNFKDNTSESFAKYYRMNAVSVDEELPDCDSACKSNHICSMEFIDLDDYEQCIASYTSAGTSVVASVLFTYIMVACIRIGIVFP